MKHCRVDQYMHVLEGEEKKSEPESLLKEIMAKNFPNLGKGMDCQSQEAQRIPKI